MKPFVKTYLLFVLSFALAATAASLALAQSNDRAGATGQAFSGGSLVLPLDGRAPRGGASIGGITIGGKTGGGQPDLVIPPSAWRQLTHPIADFIVTADPLQNITECNEGNNSAQDRCRGPAI